jgi:hypothetical protein
MRPPLVLKLVLSVCFVAAFPLVSGCGEQPPVVDDPAKPATEDDPELCLSDNDCTKPPKTCDLAKHRCKT